MAAKENRERFLTRLSYLLSGLVVEPHRWEDLLEIPQKNGLEGKFKEAVEILKKHCAKILSKTKEKDELKKKEMLRKLASSIRSDYKEQGDVYIEITNSIYMTVQSYYPEQNKQ